MPKNIIDKIWEKHIVKQNPGHPAIFGIDLQLTHEVTSPQGFTKLREKGLKVKFPHKQIATLDHSIPTRQDRENIYDPVAKKQVETLRKNTKDFGITIFDYDSGHQGIVHVIGPELGLTQPGMTIVCGDSHTSTHGAFGALAFGVGSTEVGLVMATGCILQEKPKTFKVEFQNSFPEGVYSKDAILYLISQIGVGGGNGYVMEFCGQAVEEMSMQARMSMCNMSIEGGARAGLVQPDLKTVEWVLGLEEGELSQNSKFKIQNSKLVQDPSEYKFNPNFCLELEDYKMVPISLDYTEEMFKSYDQEIAEFMYPKVPKSLEEMSEYIKESIRKTKSNKELYLLIIGKKGFVGGVYIHQIQTKKPEFSIWIKKDYQGKGLAKKSILTVKKWLEGNFDYDGFLYGADKRNLASIKFAQSLNGKKVKEYQETSQNGKTLKLIEFKIPNSLKKIKDPTEYKFDPNFCLEFEDYKMVPISLDYAEDIFKNFTDEITTFLISKPLKTLEEANDFVEKRIKTSTSNESLQLVIVNKNNQDFVGGMSFKKTRTKTPEFGIWISKKYHGKKIGRKAIKTLKNWAQQNFDYDYFLYPVDKNNIPSRKIPESLGGKIAREYQETSQSGKTLNLIEFRIPNSLKLDKNSQDQITQLTSEQKEELKKLYQKAKARGSLRKYTPKFEDWEKAIAHWLSFRSDRGAKYDKEIVIDSRKLKPMITWGTNPAQGMFIDEGIPDYSTKKAPSREMVKPLIPAISGLPATFPGILKEDNKKDNELLQKSQEQQKALKYTKLEPGQKLLDQPIDWVFLGSCTNSRMEDLRIAAGIFYPEYKKTGPLTPSQEKHTPNPSQEGDDWLKTFDPSKVKKVADGVTMYIVPGSEMVKAQAEKEGLDKIFKAAGADWRMPGCSMCLGMNDDKVPTGKRCLSTSNRNFMHRQGPGSITHLCSPATATISAIKGKISVL